MFTLELLRVHLFCVIFLFCLFYKKKKNHISLGPEVAKDCLESNRSSLFAYLTDCLRKGSVA